MIDVRDLVTHRGTWPIESMLISEVDGEMSLSGTPKVSTGPR